ncbi:GspE/PulE family protein [Vibrio sp. R78045]|uniref:GspE/PulE family protein n=1 Tax=Vibrio sp. R78045 TaxID=3093868 RepID=UPI0036F2BDF2
MSNRETVTDTSQFGTVMSVLTAKDVGMSLDSNEKYIVLISEGEKGKTAHALVNNELKNSNGTPIDLFLTATRNTLNRQPELASLCNTLRPHYVSKDIIKNMKKLSVNSENSKTDNSREKEVETMLLDAEHMGASDIHVTCDRSESKIKFRINGELEVYGGDRNQEELHSMVSVLYSSMAAKDGAIKSEEFKDYEQADAVMYRNLENKRLGVRITTHPTINVEKCYHMVMRVLGDQNEHAKRIPFEELGFMFDQPSRIKAALRGKGMVLTIGETNSGKSVSQQNYLMLINEETNDTESIYSMENPIERQLKGVTQFNINQDDNGKSLADDLISYFMRADPNTLALAEIRDRMSAESAQTLSQTGHKVFGTLHCESPFDVFERLVGLGCNHNTLSSGEVLGSVISQKLLKKICPDCSTDIYSEPSINEKQMLAIEQLCQMGMGHRVSELRFRNTSNSNTCTNPKCRHGLIGRQLIAEVVNVSPQILEPLSKGLKFESKRVWLSDNNFTKIDCALTAIFNGYVDCADVLNEIGDLYDTYYLRQEMNIPHPKVIYA